MFPKNEISFITIGPVVLSNDNRMISTNLVDQVNQPQSQNSTVIQDVQ